MPNFFLHLQFPFPLFTCTLLLFFFPPQNYPCKHAFSLITFSFSLFRKKQTPLICKFPIATFQKIEKSTIKDKSQWHETCVSLVMLQVIAFLTPMFIRLGTWGIGDWFLSAVSWCCGVQFHGFSTCSFCLHVKH